MRLDGEIAFVTGGVKNIGFAISASLAASGATVACGYNRDDAEAEVAINKIRSRGGNVRAYRFDVGNPSDIQRVVNEVREELGSISILVNNAARRPRQKIAQIEVSDWDAVHAVNLRGPFLLAQAVLPDMRDRSWGRIVNVSGIDAYQGENQRAHVVASKLGLVGLTRALAMEAGNWGVTANTVVPGHIDTVRDHPEWYPGLSETLPSLLNQIPLGRVGTVEEVASAVVYLCSREAGYMTGQELIVSGGAFPLTRQPWYEY